MYVYVCIKKKKSVSYLLSQYVMYFKIEKRSKR